jgi:hypothetical protein
MNKAWLVVLALLIAATGCDKGKEAETALKNAKKAAESAKHATKEMAKDVKDEVDDAVEQTETSAKLVAKNVLDEAIATAKTEDKALFVHFTADW